MIERIIAYGNVGVDIFLFLSGIGLYYSFQKDEQIIPFLRRRLTRVLPPVFIIFGAYCILDFLVMKYNPTVFLQSMTLMRFWLQGSGSIWFVSFILVFYLFYPTIYHYLFDRGNPTIRVLVALVAVFIVNFVLQYAFPKFWSQTEIALTRIPITILGCYFGQLVYQKKQLPAVSSLIILAAAVLVFLLKNYLKLPVGFQNIWSRSLLGLGGGLLAYSFAIIFELLGPGRIAKAILKFFGFFGWMSLEVYVAHLSMRRIYSEYFAVGRGRISQYLLFALVAIVISALIRFSLDKLSLHLKKSRSLSSHDSS